MNQQKGQQFTPTERRIILLIEKLNGSLCTKAEMAEILACNEKTVSRLIAHLRAEGIVKAQPTFSDAGAQRANSYLLVSKPEKD